jgi:hypothetical protein
MNKTSKSIILILALVLIIALSACAQAVNTPTPPPEPANMEAAVSPALSTPIATAAPSPTPAPSMVPSPAPTPAPLSVAGQSVAVSNKYVDIHTVYPKVTGMVDKPFEKDLNESAKSDMEKRVEDLQDSARAFYEEAKQKNFPYNKFSLDAALTVQYNDGMLLSMTNRFYTYTGGAHGIAGGIYYNLLNTLPARSLTLPQIFTDPVQGIARVNKQIKADIAKGDYFFPDAFKTVDEKTWFYITKNNLVIVFPEYAIAPYAAGEPEFAIPLSSLADILIQDIPR